MNQSVPTTFAFLTPVEMQKALTALVKIDIILNSQEDDWLRIFTTDLLEDGTRVFSIDNGCGDCVALYLKENHAFLRGFDHENDFSIYDKSPEEGKEFLDQIYQNVPSIFLQNLSPETKAETTFVLWNTDGSTLWQCNEMSTTEDGGREYLLGYILPTAKDFVDWAEGYYQESFPVECIQSIYNNEQTTEEMITLLNPERNTEEALSELKALKNLLHE